MGWDIEGSKQVRFIQGGEGAASELENCILTTILNFLKEP